MREPNLPLCERYLKLCIQQKLLLLGTHDFVQRNFVAYQVGRRESFLNNNSSNNNNNDQASSKIFFVENCLSVERQLSSTAKKDLTLIIRVRSSLGRGVRWLEWVGGGGATLGEKKHSYFYSCVALYPNHLLDRNHYSIMAFRRSAVSRKFRLKSYSKMLTGCNKPRVN